MNRNNIRGVTLGKFILLLLLLGLGMGGFFLYAQAKNQQSIADDKEIERLQRCATSGMRDCPVRSKR